MQALVWVRSLSEEPGRDRALLSVGLALMKKNPAQAVACLEGLPLDSPALPALVNDWALRDHKAATDWALRLPPGPTRASLIASITATISRNDPLTAAQLAAQLPSGAEQDRAVISAVSGWARRDPVAALDWVCQFQPGALQNKAYEQTLFAWGRSDPYAAADWLLKQPDSQPRDMAINAYSGTLVTQHPQFAFLFAQEIADSRLRQSRMANVIRRWLDADPDAAEAALLGSSLSPETIRRLIGP